MIQIIPQTNIYDHHIDIWSHMYLYWGTKGWYLVSSLLNVTSIWLSITKCDGRLTIWMNSLGSTPGIIMSLETFPEIWKYHPSLLNSGVIPPQESENNQISSWKEEIPPQDWKSWENIIILVKCITLSRRNYNVRFIIGS